jgi:hypothetical protein
MIRLFKFWQREAEVDPAAVRHAKRQTAVSRDRTHALFAEARALSVEAQETAAISRQLRMSNGFVESIEEMWREGEEGTR